jgi:hypothetical protein
MGDSAPDYSSIDLTNRRIDSMLHVLRQQRASNARMRNSQLPISCLPPEILSRIFVAAVANEVVRKPFSTTSTEVPLLLSHVCQTWRSVAFNLSEIWATVHCRVAKGKASIQAKHLHDWLTRSKERLLSIRISFEDELSWIASLSTAIIVTLLPHSHRWRNLDLVVLKGWFPLLDLVYGKVENLESLSIRTPGPTFYEGLPDLFAEAPRLRNVFLKCADFELPWIHITSVTLLQPSVIQVTTMIHHCPCLISGKFLELYEGRIVQVTPFPPHLTLERLSISLKDLISNPIKVMLDILTLPKLRHLSLVFPGWDWNPLSHIEALVDRSGSPLKSLEIGGPTLLTEEEIIDFLQLSKHLVHFNNHNHPFIMLNDDDND